MTFARKGWITSHPSNKRYWHTLTSSHKHQQILEIVNCEFCKAHANHPNNAINVNAKSKHGPKKKIEIPQL